MTTLNHRDNAIIEHLRRYRISTPAVLRRMFFEDLGPDAVRSAIRRLTPKFVTSRPIGPGRRVYYQLTPSSLRQAGDPEERAKPLGPDALARAFAVLHYCCMAKGKERPRLTNAELARRYPGLADTFLTRTRHADFYVDSRGGTERLGRLFVDLGGDAAGFVRKVRKFLRKTLELPAFASLLREDQVMLAVLTYRESKRDALRRAFSRESLGPPVALAIVRELEEVI